MDLNYVKNLLSKYDIPVKKQFGQNFLLDENIINNIVNKSNVDKDTCVIEIGPGLGFLTKKLVSSAYKVLCYEIDSDMLKVLNEEFKETNNVIFKNVDFLKTNIDEDIKEYLDENKKIVVVANLPYYITTAILLKILEESIYIKSLTVMMQEEVAARLCGKPSTKDYNSLSVLIQYYTSPKMIIKVSASSFYPAPNVSSAVLKIDYLDNLPFIALNDIYFKKFNRAIFSQRRKTLINNLKGTFGYTKEFIERVLNDSHLSLTTRAEELSVEQIVKLSDKFYLESRNCK